MFCPQCGREYSSHVNFCCHCGAVMSVPPRVDKKLRRSRSDRKIAGVCAGLAVYLDMDSTLVRLIWLLLVFFGGWGVVSYVIAWIVMPEEPAPETAKTTVAPATAEPAASH
jgi:phage shock protein C